METKYFSQVNKKSKIPYYLQVKEQFIKSIRERIFKPGEKIKNEYELCKIFNISRPTIRQAVRDLEFEGLLKRDKGKGTFIAERKIDTTFTQKAVALYDELKEKNIEFETKILKKKIIVAPKDIAKILELEENEKVNYVERLRLIDGKPFYFCFFYIPVKFCIIINDDLENCSTAHLLEEKYNIYIAKVKRYLEPVLSSDYKKVSKILNIENEGALHYMQNFLYNKDGVPIGYYKDYFRPDKSRFTFYLER